MSVYAMDNPTVRGYGVAFKRIKDAFPNLGKGFHTVLSERAKELNIGDVRLMDSVNHVVDNCQYPTPTIAQFLGFDKKVKLYNYGQMVNLNNELSNRAFSHYSAVKIPGVSKPMWAANNEIELYNLEKIKAKG